MVAAGITIGSEASVHSGKEARGANVPTETAHLSEASAVAPAGMSQPPHATDPEVSQLSYSHTPHHTHPGPSALPTIR